MTSIDMTPTTDSTPDPDLEVTVKASDLLWVLVEYGLLVAVTEADGLPLPPSMRHGAVDRLTEALPINGVDLPAEAAPSLILADIVATEGGY